MPQQLKRRAEGKAGRTILATSIAAALYSVTAQAQIVINNVTGSESQNFDGLSNVTDTSAPGVTWTQGVTLPGWYLYGGTNADLPDYLVSNGSSNTGRIWSFGTTSATDRALGSLASGGAYFGSPGTAAVASYMALALTNNSGGILDSFTLSFDGEQWRDGGVTSPAVPTAQSMVLEYGFGSTFASVTSWTAPGANFDFASPVFVNTGSGAAVDGNTAGLVAGRGGTINNLVWDTGSTLWIRWVDRNDASNDHGLAIDNFSISWNGTITTLLYWDLNGATPGLGGATGVWDTTTTNWSTSTLGDSAPTTFASPANKVIFAGTAGDIVLATGGVTAAGGLEFQTTGYTIKSNAVADKLTLGTNPSVNVLNAGDTTTISASIAGSNGLNKLGPGRLVLSGDNDFTGDLQINGGTVVVSSEVNLGDNTAGVALNSGTLVTTSSMTLGPNRSITGSGGTLDIAPGTTLDVTGSFNTGAITLSNSGSLFLTGSAPAIAGLTFQTGSTLQVSGQLGLSGNLVTTHTSGTVTIDGNVNAGSATRQWTIADGSAEVDFRLANGQISNTGMGTGSKIQKLGPGTIEAFGEQSTMGGWRLGNAGASFATSAVGGELRINDYNGLGNNQFQFNDGTLNVMGGVDLVGDGINAIPSGVSLSIGAGQTGVGSDGNTLLGTASFKGANIEFMGPASLFEGVAAAGAYKNHLTVANSLILSGGFNDAGGTVANPGSDSDQHSTGLLIDGPGTVVFNNAINSFGVENDPNNAEAAKTITASQATLAIDGNLTAAVKPDIEVIGDGKLQADTGTGLGEGLGSLTITDGVFAPGITGIAGLSTDKPIADVQATAFILGADGEFKLDLSTGVIGGYDQLIVTGTTAISLAGTLSLSLTPGYSFTVGQVLFPIVNSTGLAINGTFVGLAQGQTILLNEVEFIVGYGGDSVGGTFTGGDDFALFVNVPEPSSAALLAAACATLGLGRVRRRRA